METILRTEQLTAGYNGKTAIRNITMDIYKNKITAIIGPSGCGKSTLLKAINRLLEEEMGTSVSGSIYLEGQNVFEMEKEELRRKIGLVFQTPAPFPFSIYKNMTYAPKYYGVRDKNRLQQIVEEKLKMAGLYEEVKNELRKSADQLSGGQQQRLCIARALTVDPTLLLLDEPCSALDVKSVKHIEQLLIELKQNYTIVIVTHNILQAKRIADYTIFMEDGKVVEMADTETLFEHSKRPETSEFLTGNYN